MKNKSRVYTNLKDALSAFVSGNLIEIHNEQCFINEMKIAMHPKSAGKIFKFGYASKERNTDKNTGIINYISEGYFSIYADKADRDYVAVKISEAFDDLIDLTTV